MSKVYESKTHNICKFEEDGTNNSLDIAIKGRHLQKMGTSFRIGFVSEDSASANLNNTFAPTHQSC